MGRWAIVGLVVVAACGGSGRPSTTTAATTSITAMTTTTTAAIDVEAWRADLDAFVGGLERNHPDPYWRVGEEAFKADVAAVSALLPELTEDEATLEIVRLAALIDGHTSVFVGFLGWNLAHVQFYLFDDGIGVVGSGDPALVGGRLIAIGGTPADEAVDRVAVLASYDNPDQGVLDAVPAHGAAGPRRPRDHRGSGRHQVHDRDPGRIGGRGHSGNGHLRAVPVVVR